MKSTRLLWSLLAALLVAQSAPAITDDERLQTYRDFRSYFDQKQYEQALPYAERLVELTEQQYGDKARELVNPLTNLGTVYHRWATTHRLKRAMSAAYRFSKPRRLIPIDSSCCPCRAWVKPITP